MEGFFWGGSVSDMPNMRLPLVLTPSTSHVEHTYTRTYRRSRNRVSVLKERNVILPRNRVLVLMMGNITWSINPKSRLGPLPHEAKHAFTESCLGPQFKTTGPPRGGVSSTCVYAKKVACPPVHRLKIRSMRTEPRFGRGPTTPPQEVSQRKAHGCP